MISTEIKPVMERNDTELVSQSLTGSREAFGRIVEQYQSLICSLAYSATGSLTQSEDLAQETFVIAWKQLRQLREPEKLRSWLCSIARSVISSATRRQTRERAHGAEALDTAHETPAPDPLPSERAINREEEAILWRSLERIPEIYREPLILFYREHQSVEQVAAALDLSEDAVKQRLSRGRKLLQERVIAFVEGALERTAPGPAFTLGVLSALPGLTVAAGSSAIGGTALTGSAAGKAAASVGLFAIVTGLLTKFLPAVAGTWMMLKLPESQRERKFALKAYAGVWISAFLYPAMLILCGYAGRNYWDAHPQMFNITILASAFGFVAFIGPYTLWMARVQRRIQKEEAKQSTNPRVISLSQPYEYRSPQTFLGLPLLHIRWHCVKDGETLPAKGWIACGNKAYGILLASGTVAVACVSMGALAVGLVAVGGFGIGLFAFGGMALGFAVIGGAAVGYMAFGGGAIGWLGASGGATLARHFALGGGAIAEHANDQAARTFMNGSFFFRHEWGIFNILILISWLLPPGLTFYFKRRRERKCQEAKSTVSAMLMIIIVSAFALSAGSVRAGEVSAKPSFAVTVTGKGTPIILIPGLSCSGAVWDDTVEHLKDRYQCHVLTLAGFAGQPRIPAPFLETVRNDLAAYIRNQKLDHPVIIGHSLGGLLALWLAAHDPDLPGPLIIVDSLPFLPASFMPTATAETTKPMAEQMRAGMAVARPQFVTNSIPRVRMMVTKPADFDRIMSWVKTTDPLAAGDAMFDLFTHDLRGDIAQIKSPTLVLGAWIAYKDYATREEVEGTFRKQYTQLKNCQIVMADTRHFIMLDNPQWFYQQVDTFLANPGHN